MKRTVCSWKIDENMYENIHGVNTHSCYMYMGMYIKLSMKRDMRSHMNTYT
jgi:hypothetical protein